MSIRALGYVGIGVSDLTAWEPFVTGILGLQIGSRGADGTLFLRMDDRHHRIAVRPGGADDVEYLGWELAGEQELEIVAGQLRAAGITYSTGDATACRDRRVAGYIACADPAGIRAEFFWGPLVERPLPFNSPRSISGFHTGEEGVGHVVLAVPDADAMMTFYRDVLGFRVSDYIEFLRIDTIVNIAFLHCNPRHHSLAFMQVPSPRRLSHLMLEVNALDDVGRTYSLCERESVPIAMTLGRHTNDDMFSFYMNTPSGFAIEYGWGGRSVDDATWQVQRYDATSVWGHSRNAVTAPPERITR
jgi:2,3-dihydroxybiphenyl 1,2-dioxygenase